MEFNHVSKSYGDRCLIQDLDYTLARTDRIGIVGPNELENPAIITNLIAWKIKLIQEPLTREIADRLLCSQGGRNGTKFMRAIDYIKRETGIY